MFNAGSMRVITVLQKDLWSAERLTFSFRFGGFIDKIKEEIRKFIMLIVSYSMRTSNIIYIVITKLGKRFPIHK